MVERQESVQLSVAKDFSALPALHRLRPSEMLQISFEGVAGFGSSFLEEAFGGLVRAEGFTRERLRRCLAISAGKDEELEDSVDLAWQSINEA